MKTPLLQNTKIRLGASWAPYFFSVILLLGAASGLVSGAPALNRFRILIDTNQMNFSEINQIHNFTYNPFAVDGVWAMTQNNCGLDCGCATCDDLPPDCTVCIPEGHSQTSPDVPPSEWPAILLGLNAANWTITEDEALHGRSDRPPTEAINNNDQAAVQGYISPHSVDASVAFWEYFPHPQLCPNHMTELCFPEGPNCMMNPEEINRLATGYYPGANFGGPIIFLARSYYGNISDQSKDAFWVRENLASSNAAGVAFEVNPDHLANGDGNNIAEGLKYCLSQPGKQCYLLLPPSPSRTRYDLDVEAAVTYLNQHQVPLNNPKLFVVLAVYGREQTNVGFLTGGNNTGFNNSVWAAALKLQTYRNSILPHGTVGSLESVNTSATGWAVDPETTAGYSQSIQVRLYVDGPNPGSGTFVGSTTANIPRSDVNASYLGNHGFSVPIPSQYLDGLPHSWYAYGISASGNASKNSLLGNPITVTLDTTPPVVALTAPSNNAHVRGTLVTVSATASDNVGVVGVQFKINNTPLANEDSTQPYSINWNTTLTPDGPYQLTAVARDTVNTTISGPRTVTVDNTAPTGASITNPGQNQRLTGTVTIIGTASDSNLYGLQFKVDGVDYGVLDKSNPYSVPWDTTSYSNGTHQLTVEARDVAGNTMLSPVRLVTVDRIPPSGVAITAPATGATVSGATVTVSGSAFDFYGMLGVRFKVDGDEIPPGLDRTAPYSVSWNTTLVGNGPHWLTSEAQDLAGNITVSPAVMVNVNN